MKIPHDVTSWPERNCLVIDFSEGKTCKGTDIQIVASLYMLLMHRKMQRMLIKTRLILNDIRWTLSSCVSVTARFIQESIHIKDVMLDSALIC